jgi:putative peptide zinc metalloprotease protein
MSDPVLAAEVRVLEAQLRELEAQRDALVEDPFGAQIAEQEMHRFRERLDRSRQRLRDLTVLSPGAGLFMSASLVDLPGRYLAQGDLVGYVMDFERPVIRVAVPASDIDLLRENTRAITVRLSQNLAEVVPARVSQIAPAATSLVPNAALTARGGGKISIDPTEAEGNRSLEDLFHVELIIPRQRGLARIGGRAYVKFDHGYEPLGLQMYRRLRQLFLKQFDV